VTTPSQTVGPFFALPDGLPWPDGPEVVAEGTPGAVVIRGVVYDGAGDPVPDAMIETWQASPTGRFDHPDDPRGAVDEGFRAFGRSATSAQGEFWLRTVKPGPLPTADGGAEAPHIDVTVLARGLLQRLVTRIYWPDEEQANAADPVLQAVPAELRHTLIARRDGDELRFDIRLQGDGETVFFEL
jgi:protocatechuate 3,4-dioxygenase alpha subunit